MRWDMSVIRRFTRKCLDRKHRTHPYSFILACGIAVAILSLLRRVIGRGSSPCHNSRVNALSPDVLFVALANVRTASPSLKGLANLNLGGRSCAVRLYTSSEHDFKRLSHKYADTCVTERQNCRVDVHFKKKLSMWGDISLQDVSERSLVVFLREGVTFSTRALDWIKLAHRCISDFYNRGGRRVYVGATIGCHGQLLLTPKWSHSIGPLNATCAFSPVRHGREDPWEFFSSWFTARRREWVSWPHIWNEEMFVPTFWKGKSKAKRDGKLIKFGERTGTDYSYVNNPHLLWERWYPRWAANYTLRVLSAESNLGLTIDHDTAHLLQSAQSFSRGIDRTQSEISSTHYGDKVSVESVWYEPVDGAFGKGYFSALQTIVSHKPGMVSLTIVNSKFLELTKSWLCNVQVGGFVPPNVYWIALDRESKQVLDTAGIGTTVDLTDALSADNMDPVNIIYGQPAYWQLMLMRTKLIQDLLDRGIDVFLFETDQVWLQDPFQYINRELDAGADMVGTLDTQHNVAGNTLLLKSVLSTRRMWSEVYYRFKSSFDDKEILLQDKYSNTFVEHDQYQLSALLLYDTEFTQDFPVALGLLNSQLFVGGSWYSGMYEKEESKRPVIINNNFISGTEKKKSRAITFGHWFLSEDGTTCDSSAVTSALSYKFAKLPGKWWAEEQKALQREK